MKSGTDGSGLPETELTYSEMELVGILKKRFPRMDITGLCEIDNKTYYRIRYVFGKDNYRRKLKAYGFTWKGSGSSKEETLEDLERMFPDRVVRRLSDYESLSVRVKKYLDGDSGRSFEEILREHGFEYDPGTKWAGGRNIIPKLWEMYPDGVIKNLSEHADTYNAVKYHMGKRYKQKLKKEGFTFTTEDITEELMREQLEEEFPDRIVIGLSSRKLLKSRMDVLCERNNLNMKQMVEKIGFTYDRVAPNKGKFKCPDAELVEITKETFPSGYATKLTEDQWLHDTIWNRYGNPRNFLKKHGILYVPHGKPGKIIQSDLNEVFENRIVSMIEEISPSSMKKGLVNMELLTEGLGAAKSMFMRAIKKGEIRSIESICSSVYNHLVKRNEELMQKEIEIKSKLPQAEVFPEWVNPLVEFNADLWFENKFEGTGDQLRGEFHKYCEEDIIIRGNNVFATFGDLYNFFYDVHPELLIPPTNGIGSLWAYLRRIGRVRNKKEDD